MRSVPTALNDELLKETCFTAHLVEMNLSSTVRRTDLDLDLLYGGNTYQSCGLDFEGAQYSLGTSVDAGSFEIDNTTQEFSAIVQQQEVRGKTCKVSLAALDANVHVIAAGTVFSGLIDSYRMPGKRARFEVVTPFIFWSRKSPRRTHSPTCGWAFKSIAPIGLCRYAGGETWCDQSYARCQALSNTANFGGFRFLPALVAGKDLWWGRAPG